jgi:uncharacterized protein YndB with AHSA1/START domain
MRATFVTAVYIEVPPTVVCAAIADLGSWKAWMPDLVAIEKLTPGQVGPGAEWRETRRISGSDAPEQFRVTRWEPPRRIDMQAGAMRRLTYEFVPERTGTNVELVGEVRMSGLRGLFVRFLTGPIKRASHRDLEALKAHLESPWPADTRR